MGIEEGVEGIEYKGDQSNYNYSPKKFGLGTLVVKMGLAKDEAGARKVMITVIILCFALSFYFFYQAL